MPKFNDFNLANWKEDLKDIFTDSLWFISERKKGGKHSNFYHGNFVPQVAEQLIKRYSKKGDFVLDFFIGSGTTAIECEELGRNIIGVDIQKNLVERIDGMIGNNVKKKFLVGDSSEEKVLVEIKDYLQENKRENVDLVILHPPYSDIVKFSKEKDDLSNCGSIKEFLLKFKKVLENSFKLLKKGGYISIVIGDKYQNSEWIPLGFYCMNLAQQVGFKLKSIVVKNMEGNRGKLGVGGIWRYRALSSDYYIFKHEYVLILKK